MWRCSGRSSRGLFSVDTTRAHVMFCGKVKTETNNYTSPKNAFAHVPTQQSPHTKKLPPESCNENDLRQKRIPKNSNNPNNKWPLKRAIWELGYASLGCVPEIDKSSIQFRTISHRTEEKTQPTKDNTQSAQSQSNQWTGLS